MLIRSNQITLLVNNLAIRTLYTHGKGDPRGKKNVHFSRAKKEEGGGFMSKYRGTMRTCLQLLSVLNLSYGHFGTYRFRVQMPHRMKAKLRV